MRGMYLGERGDIEDTWGWDTSGGGGDMRGGGGVREGG